MNIFGNVGKQHANFLEKNINEILKQELAEEKADTQRRMAWVAMISMILYPLASLIIAEDRLDTWSAMSDMIFLSQASVIGLYFGATAYMAKK